MFSLKYKLKRLQTGFSLIELLIVISIMSLLLSVSLFNYDQFGKEVELENSVYSMALAVREAQVFGINKKAREGTSDPQDFGESYGYGVYFTKNTLPGEVALNNRNFAFFVDSNSGDKQMTGNCSVNNECYSVISIEKGNLISNILVQGTGAWEEVDDAHVYFQRPNPDAVITSSGVTYSRLKIVIEDQNREYNRCVEIGIPGDITIKNIGC